MSLRAYSPEAEYHHCVRREREERAAALGASSAATIGVHTVMAERYADRAWSLSEEFDLPYIPSGLWHRQSAKGELNG